MKQEVKDRIVQFLDSDGPDEVGTWRHWIWQALQTMFEEGEMFRGKAPLGNSGWDSQLNDDLAKFQITPEDLAWYLFAEDNP